MIPAQADRILLWGAAAHLLVGVVCLLLLTVEAAPILGLHPALKPMKFGFSIGVFLATMALIVPALGVGAGVRNGIAWTLLLTMLVEMVPIAFQAVRGTTSHFNTGGPFNAAVWLIMVAAIVVATIAMTATALVATLRPLTGADGHPLPDVLAIAWRAALWLFPLAAVSGFGMGARLKHSVGGEDGGAGLPLVNWSLTHGDLRVSHFIALHALQTLPLIGGVLVALPMASAVRWAILVVAIALHAAVAVGTLVQALASRPLF